LRDGGVAMKNILGVSQIISTKNLTSSKNREASEKGLGNREKTGEGPGQFEAAGVVIDAPLKTLPPALSGELSSVPQLMAVAGLAPQIHKALFWKKEPGFEKNELFHFLLNHPESVRPKVIQCWRLGVAPWTFRMIFWVLDPQNQAWRMVLDFELLSLWLVVFFFGLIGTIVLCFGYYIISFQIINRLLHRLEKSLGSIEGHLKEIFLGNYEPLGAFGEFTLTQRIANLVNQMTFFSSKIPRNKRINFKETA
jgi:hypothetical protein